MTNHSSGPWGPPIWTDCGVVFFEKFTSDGQTTDALNSQRSVKPPAHHARKTH